MRGDTGFPVRLKFSEIGKVRFISHRDVARAFERAFRIAELPMAFTLGFSPRPKVSFGLALSVAHESDAEYLDLELTEPVDPESLVGPLTDALPEGISVIGATALADRAPALQESVSLLVWDIEVTNRAGEMPDTLAVARLAAAVMATTTLPTARTRKGRETTEDIRPVLRMIEVRGQGECGVLLRAELSTQPVAVRPGELVAALDADLVELRSRRVAQWIERGGARLEPLVADQRAEETARAS